MKKRNILVVLTLISFFGLSVISCNKDNKTGINNAESKSINNTITSKHYPVTVETYNFSGEKIKVTFDKAPEKVICAYQNNIEIMLRLGLADRIAYAFGLDGPVMEDLNGEFKKINYKKQPPSKEEVIIMSPDLILAWCSLFSDKKLGDVDYWNKKGCGTYMSLNSGCRRFQPEYVQTIEHEIQDILTIGKIFNVEDKAKKLVNNINSEITKIQGYIKNTDRVSIAILENEKDSFRVYGSNVLGGNIATKAGAILSVGADNSKNISAEELIEKNPEVIFMVYFFGYLEPKQAVEKITKNPKFASLQAVKNNKVFALNLTNVYCSGYRSMNAVLKFAKSMYPDLYK